MADLNVGGSQTISGITVQQGEYKGHGVGAQAQGNAHGPRVPFIPESAVAVAAPSVQAPGPWWFYYPVPQYYYNYNNHGTARIEGNTKQDGTFKGHGTGASIQGGFNASGDIN
ncbi:zinc finger CCCH domain-containing protein 49-like [Senna tora]|uniref:Zinc finger CCCH domain-containing protein 49-like n=1 Tax=Senna tora TaxID=362788 RepID=A0A834X4C8_9FABA|nr:zinc finger CCCH domain-containing protein 49-like [Senna tora]